MAKAQPGKINFGSGGTGITAHLAMELIAEAAHIKVTHIPYKGSPEAMNNVIGGQIPVSMQTAPAVLSAIQAARVRPLAVTSIKRIPQLPEVPTMDETALPGFEVNSWYGLCAPAGAPAAVLDKVHADLTAVLRMPEIQQRLKDLVVEVAPTSPQEFAKFMRAETARWARVIKAAGIQQQ
jgi:tripartite-type tricarboxylate transporter receptor subunit TctC